MDESRGKLIQAVKGSIEDETQDTTSTLTDDHDDLAKAENSQKRLSSYSYSDLPEVVPQDTYAGKQVVPVDTKVLVQEDYKETVPKPDKEVAEPVLIFPDSFFEERAESSLARNPRLFKERLNRKVYGIRLKWVLVGAISLILFIIILGVGLGVGLRSGTSSRNNAQSGALEGTRIALATQTFPTNGNAVSEESLVMYFQHENGQIRWMQLGDDGKWVGGGSSNVVATNAKANTPISAVSYVWDGVSFWRVFYVDNTNVIREVWSANNTQGWALGPLSDMSISPMDDDQVGMVACWFGPTSPQRYAEGYATTTDSTLLTIRLVYAKDATTFEQLTYRGDNQIWTPGQTLSNLNGHASPTCYNPGQGTVEYLMLLDLQNTINVYWRDTDTTLTNTTSHPINQWTNASIAISNVEDAATLGYTKYLYAQDKDDKLIKAYKLNFAAENTTLDSNSGFVVQGNPGLSNTGLGITAQPNPAGGDDILALYQTSGSSISYYERDADGVSWNSANIQIP